jgi:hypothetical protein
MQTVQAFRAAEGRIWDRILRPTSNGLSIQAARSILRLEFASEDRERMRELAERARDGALTSIERDEIRDYERVGNLMALWKSKARLRLKRASAANGSHR